MSLRLGLPLLLLAAFPATGAPRVVASSPVYDDGRGEVELIAGVRRDDGTAAKISSLRLLLDGRDAAESSTLKSIAQYSADNPKWTPPFCVGVVYLWSSATPQTLLDGIESMLRHLPSRTPVYPTPYGQGYRQVLAAIPASRASSGELGEYPPIPGGSYKLVDAARFNLGKLSDDDAPLKYMVLITDGHDYREAIERRELVSVGEELARRGVQVDVVAFRPVGDLGDGMDNLRRFAEAAHARLVYADRATDVTSLVEGVAEGMLGLRHARFALPWGKRTFGGVRRVEVEATADGAVLRGEAGTVAIPRHMGWVWALVLAILLVVGWAGATFARRPVRDLLSWLRRRRPEGIEDALLEEVHELVRLGVPADRAALELSAGFQSDVVELIEMDPKDLPPERYRYLATRAGQARLREIQSLLREMIEEPTLDEQMAELLARGLEEKMGPEQTARLVRARIPAKRWSSFARASEQDIAASLEQAAEDFPPLGRPEALAFAQAVGEALREPELAPVSVGWLVRAAGPGLRGQTLLIPDGGCEIGRAPGCKLRWDDEALAASHAEIVQQGGAFLIAPRDGTVRVEGAPVEKRHLLADGETLELGGARFVFKTVT